MKKSLIRKLLSMATVLCIVMTSFVSGAAVALAATAEDGNLLANGDFELGDLDNDGMVGMKYVEGEANKEGWFWQQSKENAWKLEIVNNTTTPEGVRSGNYAALYGNVTNGVYPNLRVPVQADKTYIVSAWVKHKSHTGNVGTALYYFTGSLKDSETKDKATLSGDDWNHVLGKFTGTTNNGTATIGLVNWMYNTEFYIDDVYIGELQLKDINITVDGGENAIDANEKSSFQLGAEFKNQINTNYGLESAAVTRWELTEAVPGVSINETTGVVTTTSEVEANSIGVRVTVAPKFTGAPATIIFEKNLSVIPYDVIATTNKIVNGDFELGDVNNDGKIGNDEGWSWNKTASQKWELEIVDKTTKPDDVRSGNYAAYYPDNEEKGVFPYQSVNLEANKTYIASAWLKYKSKSYSNPQTGTFYLAGSCISSDGKVIEGVTLDSEVWKNAKAKFTTTDAASKAVTFGVVDWQYYTAFCIDDVYLGELMVNDVNLKVDGVATDTIDMQTANESKTFQLSGEILNQLGTTYGLESERVATWELTEENSGVTIDAQTGALTVTPDAQTKSIGIRATVNPTFKGAPATITFEKTLKVNLSDKIVYKAENGAVISDGQLPNGKVTSTVAFTNKTQEDVNVVIYNAIYKKLGEKIQLFKTVIKDNLTVIPGDTLIYTEENIDSIADASEYVLKTFVWTDAFMPLMPSGGLE